MFLESWNSEHYEVQLLNSVILISSIVDFPNNVCLKKLQHL